MAYSDELVVFKAMLNGGFLKVVSGCAPVLPPQGKCPPVHSHWFFALYFLVNDHCVFRIKMLWFQQLSWLISPNRNYGQIETSENLTNLLENPTITCIPRVKYFLSSRCLYHKTSPQSLALVKHSSPRPMANWDKSYLKLLPIYHNTFSLSPIQFFYFTIFRETVSRLKSHDKCRIEQTVQFIDRGCVKVVIMIVADHNQINFRELTDLTGDLPESFWAQKLDRRTSVWKYRVNNYIYSASNANNSCWMANPSVSYFVGMALEVRIFVYG